VRVTGKPGVKERLRHERDQRCWSQEEVAEKIGTTALNVSRWERGVTLPGPHFRQQLCALFDKTPSELGLVSDEQDPVTGTPPDAPSVTVSTDPLLGFAASPAHPGWATVFSPPAPINLIGRDEQRALLRKRLREHAPAVVALSGLPGVGKTALAIDLIYDPEVQRQYPDGILWAPLGQEPNVLSLLSGWGVAVGLDASQTSGLTNADEWANALHSAIGNRRMLMVVDDVWNVDDALTFKVGSAGCAHVITTRFPEIALRFAGEAACTVRELDDDHGLALLTQLAPEAVHSEPGEAVALVRSVGGLPMALMLMGRYLQLESYSGQPRRLRAAIDRLRSADTRQRLKLPQAPVERPRGLPSGTTLTLQAAIEMSDQRLEAAARAALRALAVFPAKPNCFSEEAALAVGGTSPETLDALTDSGLLEACGPGRYTVHQTIADYARLSLDSQSYQRMVDYYVAFVRARATDYPALDFDLGNVLAAVQIAAEQDLDAALTEAALALAPFLELRGLYSVAEQYLNRAQQAAAAVGDEPALVLAWLHLGRIAELRGNLAAAEEIYQRAVMLARQLDDHDAITRLLAHWGEVAVNRGEFARAEQYLREGLTLAESGADRTTKGLLLRLLGEVNDCRGDYAEGDRLYEAGLIAAREVGDNVTVGAILQNLGEKAMKRGDYDQAEQLLTEGLDVARTIAHQQRVSALLNNMGALAQRRQQYDEADVLYAESLELARGLGHAIRIGNVLLNMGKLACDRGEYSAAETYLRECLDIARRMGQPYLTGDCLAVWGDVYLAQGQLGAAAAACTESIAIARDIREPETEAIASYCLARVAHAEGDPAAAQRHVEASLEYLTASGHERLAEVRQWAAVLQAVVRPARRSGRNQ
jgi:tetratricopeptide (TPR) repeat protein/transcriptional regulator with XRE-family HTH domain